MINIVEMVKISTVGSLVAHVVGTDLLHMNKCFNTHCNNVNMIFFLHPIVGTMIEKYIKTHMYYYMISHITLSYINKMYIVKIS